MDPNPPAERVNDAVSGRIPRRVRVRILVIAGAAVAAGLVTAGALLLTGNGGEAAGGETGARPLRGAPPIVLELPPPARRTPVERALARAARDPAAALPALRALPDSDVRVQIARAVAGYRRDRAGPTQAALERLPADDPAVALHLGLVAVWAGDTDGAVRAWRRAWRLDPYGFYGVRADNALHPAYLPGYPGYVAAEPPKRSPAALRQAVRERPDDQAAWLQLAAALPLEHRPEAIAAARRARTLDPLDTSAQVALAVLSFRKDDPARSVGMLGTMTQRAPDDPQIRFHFGLLLLWLGRTDDALGQFRQAAGDDPNGRYGAIAAQFIDRLEQAAG
jgi:tetratricopeptide (TPR) repeat protein